MTDEELLWENYGRSKIPIPELEPMDNQTPTRKPKHLFHDEQGNWSAARIYLFAVLLFTLTLIWRVVAGKLPVDNAVWTLLGSLITMLICWAGGPRVAQYVAPHIGEVAGGISQALKAKLPSTEPTRQDDERGD